LGIKGLPTLNARSIYGDDWAGGAEGDEDAVGVGEGDDWEDEVDREFEEEMEDVKAEEIELTGPPPEPERRVRVVRRLVERPKTVYERFPTYEKERVLDFTELFKGHVVKKSRVNKRPFHGV
jgi:transcription initiation factor TFIID subunit 1, fungi type